MTTLIPKFDFKNGGSTPAGAANRPINEKLGDWVSVKDFGATGDGSTDDTAAIQAAIDYIPNGLVYFPEGSYKITDTINLKGSILGTGMATIIEPATDDFPAFTNNNVGIQKFSVKGLFINYGVATGDTPSSNSASAGFNMTGSTSGQWPFEYEIEEVWIRYAYYGYKDSSSSYMFTLNNVRADYATIGFSLDTNGKTTVKLSNCFVVNASSQAYYFFGINGLIFEAGGFDNCTNAVSGSNLFYCATCQGVNLRAVDFESNTIGYEYTAALAFSNCAGVSINGIKGYANTFATGSTEVSGIYFADGSFGTISNVTLGAAGDVSSGTGGMYSVLIAGASRATIDSCNFVAPTGTSGNKYGLFVNGASNVLVTSNNVLTNPTVFDGSSKLVNNSLPTLSSDVGDADKTVTPGVSNPTQLYNTAITATRTVTLNNKGLFQGASFTVVRTAAATGAFNVAVYDAATSSTIKNLTAGNWVTVTYTGSAWIETATGSV